LSSKCAENPGVHAPKNLRSSNNLRDEFAQIQMVINIYFFELSSQFSLFFCRCQPLFASSSFKLPSNGKIQLPGPFKSRCDRNLFSAIIFVHLNQILR